MISVKKWKNIISRSKKILHQLPGEAEKNEIVKEINEIIKFLNDTNNFVKSLPTLEEANKAKVILEKFEDILERNPLIKKVLSNKKVLSGKQQHKKFPTSSDKKQSLTRLDSKEVEDKINEFMKMSQNDLSMHLQQQYYSKKELMAILSGLMESAPKNAPKRELIQRIIAAITNRKTFLGLRSKINE